MKKINYLKSIATIALFAVAGTGAFAQVTGTGSLVEKGAAPEDVDYVTVNSTMPYQVTPFDWGTLAPIMNPSIYKWSITTGTSGTNWTMLQSDGATALTDLSPANVGYYSQNAISIKWLSTGSYVMNVTERSQPQVGTACEQGTPENLTVNILPWPKAAWGTNVDPSTCGLSGNVTVNLACTGSQALTVSYNVYFTALAATSTRTKLNPTLLTVSLTNAGYNVAATGSITYNVASGSGKYEIEIVNITDKITEKSFGVLATTDAARNATAADLPAAPYTFYSLPTPTTQPIQHITNL